MTERLEQCWCPECRCEWEVEVCPLAIEPISHPCPECGAWGSDPDDPNYEHAGSTPGPREPGGTLSPPTSSEGGGSQ